MSLVTRFGMRISKTNLWSIPVLVATLLGIALSLGAQPAKAQNYQVLVYFTGQPVGIPYGITFGKDPQGQTVIFGAAELGNTNCPGVVSCGMIFQLDEHGTQTVLYSFKGGNDGAFPVGYLVQDAKGNLYGTTYYGGQGQCMESGNVVGCGTIFRLSPPRAPGRTWSETVLYSFRGDIGEWTDGFLPFNVVTDSKGNLYGTTEYGGAYNLGTVFKFDSSGETVLYNFTGGSDGGQPEYGLVLDPAGNLYGTTYSGGIVNCSSVGCGVVFKVNPAAQTETVVYAFTGAPDEPEGPATGLIRDAAGNLYGATMYNSTSNGGLGYGSVFKISPEGEETVLYLFQGFLDGGYPSTGIVRDNAGNLYGATYNFGEYEYGTIFEVKESGKFVTLHQNDELGGIEPSSTPLLDSTGHLYGSMSVGGNYQYSCSDYFVGCGTLYRLTP